MKILFLIAPSEWKNKNIDNTLIKNTINITSSKKMLSFNFEKPLDIACNATEKDLKCSGDRYKEGINLNQNINKITDTNSIKINAIRRYSGVMYNAIDYIGMNKDWQTFFENNFLILSGMYGIIKPLDKIWNYKLPIETKGLYNFWGDKIIDKIIEIRPDCIVNLLPMSYAKMAIVWKWKEKKLSKSGIKIININFWKEDGTKIAHWVKKLRWEWIKHICDNNITDYRKFGGEICENKEKSNNNVIDVDIALSK